MAKPQDQQLVEQWRSLQTTYFQTAGALERALEAKFNIGLTEFEILDLVAENADAACRMKQLGERTPMTQSAMSKVVDRLDKAGLISRHSCEDDRRSLFVELTDAGRALHRQAAVEHRALLRQSLRQD